MRRNYARAGHSGLVHVISKTSPQQGCLYSLSIIDVSAGGVKVLTCLLLHEFIGFRSYKVANSKGEAQ